LVPKKGKKPCENIPVLRLSGFQGKIPQEIRRVERLGSFPTRKYFILNFRNRWVTFPAFPAFSRLPGCQQWLS
jgi:hypothetical protein